MGEAVKRSVNALVVVLAGVAFFTVPIGKRTLAGHAVAIFTTGPAKELGTAVESACKGVKKRAEGKLGLEKSGSRP